MGLVEIDQQEIQCVEGGSIGGCLLEKAAELLGGYLAGPNGYTKDAAPANKLSGGRTFNYIGGLGMI